MKMVENPRLNFRVRVVVDYADMQVLNFAIKYLCGNKKVFEKVVSGSKNRTAGKRRQNFG